MKLKVVEPYSGRVELVVTWADGRVTRLPRINAQEAADTIDDRYRGDLVASARVLSFPDGEPVELPAPTFERHWLNRSGGAHRLPCDYCGAAHDVASLSSAPGEASRVTWLEDGAKRHGVVELERPGMVRVVAL